MRQGLDMESILLNRRNLVAGLAAGVAGLAGAPGGMASTAYAAAADSGSSAIETAMKAAYVRYRELAEGKNADYIPALAAVPSS